MFLTRYVKVLCLSALMVVFAFHFSKAAEKFKIVTTFTVIADMARNVAGDAAEVHSIIRPGAEIHNYQPTPRDIAGVQDADLVLWNGLNLEQWFGQFFRNFEDIPTVIVSENIVPISIAEGAYSGKPNPHAWMSPENAAIYIDNIRDALVQYDPDHADIYHQNAENYKAQIAQMIAPVREKLANVPAEQRWLVTSEGAFSYLARDLELKELYLWAVNADQQGTPQQVRRVIDTIRANNIKVAFSESTISPKPIQQVAHETGIKYGGVLYVDSLTQADGPVPTYLDLLRVTCETIVEGLTQ